MDWRSADRSHRDMEEGEMNLDNKFQLTQGVIVLRTFVCHGTQCFQVITRKDVRATGEEDFTTTAWMVEPTQEDLTQFLRYLRGADSKLSDHFTVCEQFAKTGYYGSEQCGE